ncbi:endonuclease/exonuclease/phosphatase family protein [Paeniglutamicibacter sp. NPDC012692]|uniref:endonuclease/exonuclease/phosphatase family protein n=1 Tax=Paeniglutamicibacter sp. NPDC012692 TaxID=3364388 RepID=UPI00367CFCFB
MDSPENSTAIEHENRSRLRGRAFRNPRLSGCTALAAFFLAVLPHLDLLGRGWIPVLQALVPALCLAAAVVALLLALGRRRAPALLLVAGAVLGLLPTLVPVAGMPAASPAAPLTVFSVNVEHSQADVGALADAIEARRADVVVLVEVDEELLGDLLARGVKGILPYRSPAVTPGDTAGTAILSRFPLKPEPRIPLAEGIVAFDQPAAVIEHPRFGPIRVAAVHPYAPVVDGAHKWRSILKSIGAWQARHTDIPMVLAGDFNAGHAHPAFRELARNFADTSAAAGILPIPTWPATGGFPAFTAIDHILVRGLAPTGWQRVLIPGTDHYGIIATVTGIEPGRP